MEFTDEAGNKVTLLKGEPVHAHVLVIPKYRRQYVMTRHSLRGTEFPGGKVERGERTVDAAFRELYEETGAKAAEMKYVASYTVHANEPFTKDVFTCNVHNIEALDHYMETDGPVLYSAISDVPPEEMSPLLRDACIQYIAKELI